MSASIVGLIIAAVGTAVSTTTSVRASNTAQDEAKYAGRIAKEQAQEAEASQRRKATLELGRERALLGKLGILPDRGSPLEQLARNAGEAERGALLARRGLLEEASLYELRASSISSQKGLLAASNVLTGLGGIAEQASPLLQKRTPPGNSAGTPYTGTRGYA